VLPGTESEEPRGAGGRARRHRKEARSVKEILPEVESWREAGEKVVVATVGAPRRWAPRPVATSLAVSESGKMCGSVSGGCVETDVYENAMEVMRTGEPKLLSYGITDDLAWSVGLPCGGEIDVFVEAVESSASRGSPNWRRAAVAPCSSPSSRATESARRRSWSK